MVLVALAFGLTAVLAAVELLAVELLTVAFGDDFGEALAVG